MIEVEEKLLDEITECIYRIVSGEEPAPIADPEKYPDNEMRQLVLYVNRMVSEYREFSDFAQGIAAGKLDQAAPTGMMRPLQLMKALQSNLRHLTWQTQQVAIGDFDQKVAFMGNFSAAFNAMTLQLKLAFEKIDEQNRELKEANLKLSAMTKIDGLTGISNRRHFDDTLATEWRRCFREKTCLGVIILDIDFFKRYNDGYGHLSGDDCIKRTAEVIRSCAQRASDLAARYGGEEFAVILPSTGIENVVKVGEKIRRSVEELGMPHAFSDAASVVTVSVGCASAIPSSESSAAKLVERADLALYRAKKEGRNRVACDPVSAL